MVPQSVFGIFFLVIVVALGVAVLLGFGLYVVGAETHLALTWGWKLYSSLEDGFSIRHPDGVTIDRTHVYRGLGPTNGISGTSFSLPSSMTEGTNLSKETLLAVEKIPHAISCDASLFLYRPKGQQTIHEGGVEYSFAMEQEITNGRIREEKVYAFVGSSPCTAVRYSVYADLIRTDDIAAVKPYSREKLTAVLDAMRTSVTFLR